MRILFNEMKKICNWRILLLLALINFILYFLFIEFHISHFPNGRPALDSYRIGIEMIDKYGINMNEADLSDFKSTYEAQIEEANRYLQSREEFVRAGMTTYEEFRNHDRDNKELTALKESIMFEEEVDLFWELQAKERLIDYHDDKVENLLANRDGATEAQQARFDKLIDAQQYQLYPEIAIENYKSFILNVAIAIIVSVVLVMSPLFIKDRMAQMLDLQYTTKKGRNLYKTKIVAGFLSTFIMITTLLTFYFILYASNDTSMYFSVPVQLFLNSNYWYDPTFFQYIVLTVAALYVLGFTFVLLAMVFSSLMPNYVSLIGIQVPIVIGLIVYGLSIMLERIIDIELPQWMVPVSYSTLVIVSSLLLLMTWKREKRRDIVM